MLLVFLLAGAADITANGNPLPPLKFGASSDLLFSTGTAMRFSASAPMINTGGTQSDFTGEALVSLAADYFVAKNLSVGGFASVSYEWSQAAYGPGFGVGPRIGYNVPFSDWVSVWPRLDLSFGAQGTYIRNALMAVGMTEGLKWFFNAQMNLPLVFNIFNHAVFGIGPFFAFQPTWRSGNGALQAFAINFGLTTFVGIHY